MIYLPFKNRVERIIRKHFPAEIANRFSYRMDSEIWIPGHDKDIWNRKRLGIESCHVLFDMIHVFEIGVNDNPATVEVNILKAFKHAIMTGKLSISKKPEFMTPQEVRARKRVIQSEKKKALQDSILEAKAHPLTSTQITNIMKARTRTRAKLNKLAKGTREVDLLPLSITKKE